MKKEMQFFEHMTDMILFIDMKSSGILYLNQCAKNIFYTDQEYQLVVDCAQKEKEKGRAVIEINGLVYELQLQESFQSPDILMVRGTPVGDLSEPIDYSKLLCPYHGINDFNEKVIELQDHKEKDIGIFLVELCAKKEYFAENAQIHALWDLVQQSFKHYEVFHISINTFVIMTSELTQDEFNEKRSRLHGYIEGCDRNIIYFGYAWCEDADEIRNQIVLANTYLQQRKERANSNMFHSESITKKQQTEELRTILIVDKDKSVKETLEDIFAEKYVMLQVENWMEALTNRKKHVDLILLEADQDGHDFLNYIRKYNMFYQVPIIIMYSEESEELGFYYQKGISHGIQKPFQKAMVQYKIENTMKYREYVRMGNHYGSLDKVTGLANVDYFYDLAREIIKEKQHTEKLAFVYFDIENFKIFNSEYGYDEGDELLRKLATLISDTFTKYFVGRTSNDHFIVLTDEKNIERKIKKIHDGIYHLQNQEKIKIRAGIYLYESGVSVAQSHDRAKTACDALKRDYHKVFRYYDQELRDMMIREKYVADHIDEAIQKEQITVYYQPIKRVFSGKVCAMEALARWNDPELGFLSPAEFIPILEKKFLIHKLDTFMVDRVCRDMVASRELGETIVPVSVNFSRIDFQLMDVCRMLHDTTKKYGVKPKFLHPEVTESALNDKEEQLIDTVTELQEAGFEVWLDDFGSEYSSLNTLQNFKFDLLKIDMKLMLSFETNANARIIIASIVDMAKRLHMRVLAEGVETEEEYEFLRQIGCDKAQGYYICKPSPIDALYGRNSSVESEADEEFFKSIGKVNFLSPNPMEEYNNDAEIYNVIPTAIVRYQNDEFQYLFANQGFKACLLSMGVTSMEASHYFINDDSAKLKTRLVGVALKSHLNQKMESVDFIFYGQHINVSAKEIFSDGNSQALFVTMMNLSQMENVKKIDKLEHTLNFLYSIYDRVDILDMEEDCIENIYMSSSYYRTLFGGKTLKESILDYANTDISSEDREKFLEFYDVDTLENRISKTGKGYIVSTIRTMTQKDGVHLQIYIIIRVNDGQSIRYLSCVRDIIGIESGDFDKGILPESVKESQWYKILSTEMQASFIEWNVANGESCASGKTYQYVITHNTLDTLLNNKWDKQSVYPEDVEIAEQFFEKANSGVKRCEAAFRLKLADGRFRWSRVIGLFQYDEHGVLRHVTGIVQDVEEQKNNLEQAKFLNMMPTALGVFEVRNGVTRQLFMNDGYYKLLGDEREKRLLSRKTFFDGIYPDDRKTVLQAMKTVIEGKQDCSEVCRVITGQGKYKWIRFTSLVAKREKDYILVYTTYIDADDEIRSIPDI